MFMYLGCFQLSHLLKLRGKPQHDSIFHSMET